MNKTIKIKLYLHDGKERGIVDDKVYNKILKDNLDLNTNTLNNKFGSYVAKSSIVNNLLATTAGSVLDATQGKVLNDKITAIPTITYATAEPTSVAANNIVMVYE